MRVPAIALLVALMVALAPRPGQACLCSGPVPRAKKAFKSAALVVEAPKTCAYGFEKGKHYLVYAHSDGNGGFSTNYCTRTAPLAEAQDDIEFITGKPAPAPAPVRPAVTWSSTGRR